MRHETCLRGERRARARLDADRGVGGLGVRPVVAAIAVLRVDHVSGETRDTAGGDDEDGKRPEGRLDRDRDQERDGSGGLTLPVRAVIFISRLGYRLSARNRSPRPRRCPSRLSQPKGGRLTDAVDPPGARASAMGRTPGAGASRRQVPPLAPPRRCRARQGSGVSRGTGASPDSSSAWQRQRRDEGIGARRGAFPRRHRRSVRTRCFLARAPGCGRGSLTAGGGRSRTAC